MQTKAFLNNIFLSVCVLVGKMGMYEIVTAIFPFQIQVYRLLSPRRNFCGDAPSKDGSPSFMWNVPSTTKKLNLKSD